MITSILHIEWAQRIIPQPVLCDAIVNSLQNTMKNGVNLLDKDVELKSDVNFLLQKFDSMANDEIDLSHLNQKLRLGSANAFILESLCSRHGLQERTRHRVIPRC